MARSNPAYCTEPALGVNLQSVFTASPLVGYDNPPMQPGTLFIGTDASEWLWIQAATTINFGDCVHIDLNSNASQMTQAFAAGGLGDVGFCQVKAGIPQGSYGYVAIQGNDLQVSVASGNTPGAPLYTTATPGVLGSTSSGQTQVYGVKTVGSNTSGATAQVDAIANAPRTTT